MIYEVECYAECNLGATKFFVSSDEKGSEVKRKICQLFGRRKILSVKCIANPAKVIARFNSMFA